jgi:Schlafen, AlbA_2
MALWIPRSVEHLEESITTQMIGETHYLDCKQFTESGGVPSSAAKCAASLAVDGGVLILGIAENKALRRFELKPVGLRGLRDAVDSSITSRVSPYLRTTIAEFDRGDGTGYLVVTVPQSPGAPHMFDGRYYGRSDTAAVVLSDNEVRRLWLRHIEQRDSRLKLLAREVEREPIPVELRRGARLFVVAQPLSADPRLLLSACDGRDLWRWVSSLLSADVFTRQRQYAPHLGGSGDIHRRAWGVSRSSHHLETDRTATADLRSPEDIVDLEIREDGGLRHYYGRASDKLRDVDYLLPQAIAGEVSGVIEFARVVAAKTGFSGGWTFGIALRGLQSLPTYSNHISGEPHWRYSEDGYDETTEADYATLFDAGSPILDDLLGRFMRATFAHTDLTGFDVFPRTEA